MSVQYDLTQCVTQSQSKRPAYNTIPRTHARAHPLPIPCFFPHSLSLACFPPLYPTAHHHRRQGPPLVCCGARFPPPLFKKEREGEKERKTKTNRTCITSKAFLPFASPSPSTEKERKREEEKRKGKMPPRASAVEAAGACGLAHGLASRVRPRRAAPSPRPPHSSRTQHASLSASVRAAPSSPR